MTLRFEALVSSWALLFLFPSHPKGLVFCSISYVVFLSLSHPLCQPGFSPLYLGVLVWVFPTEESDRRTWVLGAGVRGRGERGREGGKKSQHWGVLLRVQIAFSKGDVIPLGPFRNVESSYHHSPPEGQKTDIYSRLLALVGSQRLTERLKQSPEIVIEGCRVSRLTTQKPISRPGWWKGKFAVSQVSVPGEEDGHLSKGPHHPGQAAGEFYRLREGAT